MKNRKPRPGGAPDEANKRYHDRVARAYDTIYDTQYYWKFVRDLTWKRLLPFLPANPANCSAIDIGCGTGVWGLRLLKSGFGRVTFLDLSAGMMAECRHKLAEHDPARWTALEADIVDMTPVPDGTHQLAICQGDILSFCSDPVRALAETGRILAPGGVACFSVDNKFAALEWFFSTGRVRELPRFLRDGRTIFQSKKDDSFPTRMFEPAELARLFVAAGFEPLAAYSKTVLPVRAHDQLLRDPALFKMLLQAELELSRDPQTAAAGSHLEIIARKG